MTSTLSSLCWFFGKCIFLPVSMLQTELAPGRVFQGRKLTFTMSSSFFISSLEFPGDHQGFPDQPHHRRARRPGEEGSMVLSGHFGMSPFPLPPHTHVLLAPQRVTGSFTHRIDFPKNMENHPKYYWLTNPNLYRLEGSRRGGL